MLLGFLCGSSVAYFLKGTATWCIKNGMLIVANEKNEKTDNQRPQKENEESLFVKLYKDAVWRVLVQLLVCTATILLLGWLFGTESMIGYVIGLNFVAVHLVLNSLLTSYSLKNAKALAEIEEPYSTNAKETELAAKAVESTPGSALLNFLAYNTLLVLFAAATFSGFDRKHFGTSVFTPEDDSAAA